MTLVFVKPKNDRVRNFLRGRHGRPARKDGVWVFGLYHQETLEQKMRYVFGDYVEHPVAGTDYEVGVYNKPVNLYA